MANAFDRPFRFRWSMERWQGATMDSQIEAHGEELNRLCQRYQVSRLELFGSAAGERFDTECSDLDFLVEFVPLSPPEHANSYFSLLEALQDLFQRPIELVELKAIRNPYFQSSVDRTRVLLYAA